MMLYLAAVTSRFLLTLFRYSELILLVSAAVILLWRSLRALVARISEQQESAHGFFLLSKAGMSGDQVASFPLYHTTAIGRSLSSDIRVRHKGIKRHHALIYLYNGRWMIRADGDVSQVKVNGRKLKQQQRLKNQDVISFLDDPSQDMVFVDERASARSAGLDYEADFPQWQMEADLHTAISSRSAWFCGNLFLILSGLSLFLLLPAELQALRPLLAIIMISFFALAQISYLTWPKFFYDFDQVMFTAIIILSGLGLVLQSRLALLGLRLEGQGGALLTDRLNSIVKSYLIQSLPHILGLIALPVLVLLVSRTRLLEKIAPLCLWLTPGLYALTLFFGRDVAGTGAGLWIVLPGGISLQLTEFAKISYLIVLAYFFMNRPPLKRQVLFAIWAAVNFTLILGLPDLGSMMILLPVTLIVFAVMTSEYFKTAVLLAGGSGIFAFAYHFFPYVQRRIYGWLTLWDEVNAQNSQIIYGLQAIGRGSFFGRGLGVADPLAIPLASSDMIFTFLSEEMGLLTGLAVVALFIVIWLRASDSLLLVRDGFSSALILALSSYFFVEAAVVIAGSVGLIPLTGATLPFIARGSSSLLAKWIVASILMGLCDRREKGAYRS